MTYNKFLECQQGGTARTIAASLIELLHLIGIFLNLKKIVDAYFFGKDPQNNLPSSRPKES